MSKRHKTTGTPTRVRHTRITRKQRDMCDDLDRGRLKIPRDVGGVIATITRKGVLYWDGENHAVTELGRVVLTGGDVFTADELSVLRMFVPLLRVQRQELRAIANRASETGSPELGQVHRDLALLKSIEKKLKD